MSGLCKLYATMHYNGKHLRLKDTPFLGLSVFLSEYVSKNELHDFLHSLLPTIASCASDIEENRPDPPLHYSMQQKQGGVTLERKFAASAIACGFLCLHQRPLSKRLNLQDLNFGSFFMGLREKFQREKLRCILHYFRRLGGPDVDLSGNLVFNRVVLRCRDQLTNRLLENSLRQLCPVEVRYTGRIEDSGSKALQVMFASENLGGGVLFTGNTQEEIRFCVSPELLVSLLFVESMQDNEAVLIQGFEQFSKYSGYAKDFCFAGDYKDNNERDAKGNLSNMICAIDAQCNIWPQHWGIGYQEQYSEPEVLRDINKAYAGFNQPSSHLHAAFARHKMAAAAPNNKRPVATGNWGSGSFGGNPQLKAMIQWLVASYCGCPGMVYFTFGNDSVSRLAELSEVVRHNRWTVARLMMVIRQFSRNAHREIIRDGKRSSILFDTIFRGCHQSDE